jgi:hypothetical protein
VAGVLRPLDALVAESDVAAQAEQVGANAWLRQVLAKRDRRGLMHAGTVRLSADVCCAGQRQGPNCGGLAAQRQTGQRYKD